MNPWQRRLQQSSRSRGFLWRFALGMLLAGAVVGYAVSRLSPPGSRDMAERIALSMAGNASPSDSLVPGVRPFGAVAALETELRDPAVEFVHVLDFMPTLATWSYPGEDGAIEAVLATRFTAGEIGLAMDLLAASRGGSEAEARLRDASESAAPPRYAAYARGLLEMERRAYRTAYVHFRQEGERPEAEEARRRAIATLTAVRDWNEIQRLKDDPAYAALIAPGLSLQLAIDQQDWAEIVRRVPGAQIANLNAGILLLMLVTALAWGFFLAHLGEFSAAPAGHAVLCLLALVAGAVSTIPTILVVIWQDEFLHFSPEGEMLRSFLYYIGGVGLREEVCKLLLFAPFLPFLIRRDDELEVLIVASFVGLGFAVAENGSYFLSTQGVSAAGRFLTANFLHVALTGLNGLALFRACTRGMAGLNEFLYVLGITVLAHGLYDGLLGFSDPMLGMYLAMAVFILISRVFFNRAHELRANTRMIISLSGAFVFGVALVASAMLIFQMARLGPAPGLMRVVPEFIGSGLLLLMFFREFDEPLAE